MDVHDTRTRSFNMSRIKSSGTKPELIVRKLCHSLGLRYRLNNKILGTRPDLVFKKHKTAIFVHGCFWHSHRCKYGKVIPKTNEDFWVAKRKKTIQRDNKNYNELLNNEWKYLIIWECELKNIEKITSKIMVHFQLR